MFSGWKLVQDMDTLIQPGAGQFTFDFIAKTVKLNNEQFEPDVNMLFEISNWFEKDLTDNNIEKTCIRSATLIIDFNAKVIERKPKSKTKKIIEINLKMKFAILIDEKDYSAEKAKIMEYRYIDNKITNSK